MANIAARKTWVLIHRYLGFALGAWFALLGLSGSVLVYQDAIDAWLNPALLRDDTPGAWLGPAEITARANAALPATAIERIRLPQAPGEVYRLLVRDRAEHGLEAPRREAMFSPASGALRGVRKADAHGCARPYLLNTVYDLHHKILLGNSGKTAVGVVGLMLLASIVIGFVLALLRSRRQGYRHLLSIKWRARAVRIVFDIHRSLGTLALGLLLLSTTTGFTLVFPDYARDIVRLFSRVAAFPAVPWRNRGASPPPAFADVVEGVRRRYPDCTIREIHLPLSAGGGYLFYLHGAGDVHKLGDTLIWLDPGSGEILLERSAATRSSGEGFLHWLLPLHSGVAFGLPGKLLMCGAGLAPAVLAFTGVFVWLKKRRARRLRGTRRQRANPPVVPA